MVVPVPPVLRRLTSTSCAAGSLSLDLIAYPLDFCVLSRICAARASIPWSCFATLDFSCAMVDSCSCTLRWSSRNALVLFEKLVEQHRVDGLVAHAVGLTLLVANDQIRVDRFYVFSNESKLRYGAGSCL